jgi:hypothetical protein
MRIGEVWAYRSEPGRLGGALDRVEIVRTGEASSPGTLQVRFLDGCDAAGRKWVGRRTLVVPWGEVAVFVRDEQREMAVAAASCAVRGSVDFEAAALVISVVRPRGRLKLRGRIADAGVLEIRNLDLVASWLRLSADQLRRQPLVFEDRNGRCLVPWQVTLRVVRRVAQAFAGDVLREAGRREDGFAGERPVPSWLCAREEKKRAFRKAVLVRVREWCGVGGGGSR